VLAPGESPIGASAASSSITVQLIESIFERNNLELAYDQVVHSVSRSSCRTSSPPERKRARIRNLRAGRADTIQAIINEYKQNGIPEFSRRVTKIPKLPGGQCIRPISSFPLSQRVILRSTLICVWPLLEELIVPNISYCTFRKTRALKQSRGLVAAVSAISELRAEYNFYAFETDIQRFFDEIDQERLLNILRPFVKDSDTMILLQAILESEPNYDPVYFKDSEILDSTRGVPQGAALSPLLACAYLSPFDTFMCHTNVRMYRYVDDLVFLGTQDECLEYEILCKSQLKNEFGLSTHEDPSKTRHVGPTETLTFLGHDILPDGTLRPSAKRQARVVQRIFEIVCGFRTQYGYIHGLPKANHKDVVEHLTSYLLGYFSSMGHCKWLDSDFASLALSIGNALESRGLQANRLSKALRSSSQKWPSAFLEALP
ncbi:MAG: reverse transcriptase domain-containing protein, partial [Armatimonadota bacterium]